MIIKVIVMIWSYVMNHPDSDDHQGESDDHQGDSDDHQGRSDDMVICDSGFLKPAAEGEM